MASGKNQIPRRPGDAVMQGWLSKLGEHIRNWRSRYFFLYSDGALLGFKQDPRPCEFLPHPPENDFKLNHVQILYSSKLQNAFSVRCVQCVGNEMIIRRFCANTVDDRDRWITAMLTVNRALEEAEKRTKKHFESPADFVSRYEAMDTSESALVPSTSALTYGCNGGGVLGDDASSRTALSYGLRALNQKLGHGLDSFEFLKVLGRGTFGKVILCREKKTQKLYALKVLQKKVIVDKDEVAHTLAENRVLHNCDHPFLTRLEASFQTQHHLCYVLEFANGGELYFHLRQDKVFSEARTRFYGAEILLALEYLHDRNIIYRDMKLENLLLDKDGHVKLADFGLCKEDIKFGDTTVTFCGTPEYLAPEILYCNQYGRAVDWWGLGVVMYEMVVGRLPFFSSDHDHEKLFTAIMQAQPRLPLRLLPETRDLLSNFLDKDPTTRLGGGPNDAKDAKVHPFFSGVDWEKVFRREYPTPFRPLHTSDTDTSYFDEAFTNAPVQLTPPGSADGSQSMDGYRGYDDSAFDQFPYYEDSSRSRLT